MVYPIILLCVSVLSVLILVIFVVPQFKQIFDQSGKALPLMTEIVLTTGIFLRKNWPVILAVLIAGFWLFKRSLKTRKRKAKWDARVLRWPIAGGLIARLEMARFHARWERCCKTACRCSRLVDPEGNAGQCGVSRRGRSGGARTERRPRHGKPMNESGVFPKLAVQMIGVGEETGRLDEMLFQVADVYDREKWPPPSSAGWRYCSQ